MPTYQYACKDCDNHFEQVQAFSDPSLTVCTNCGGHLRKVYGSVGVVFKGSGFYRTDSRSGSGASKASLTADHKAESSGMGTSESSGTTITKPAAPAKPAASTPAKAPAPAAS